MRGGDAGWRYRLSVAYESNLAKIIIHDESPNVAEYRRAPFWGLSNSSFGLWHADDYGASAGQFFFGDFRYELQVEADTLAFLTCQIVEKVDYISAKSIPGSTAFIQVKRAD